MRVLIITGGSSSEREISLISANEVKKALVDAGALIGLGDYRPRFGRFNVEFV